MTGTIDAAPPRAAVRIAGFMFLLAFILPTLNWVLLLSTLVVPGDAVATAANIVNHDLRFRMGMTVELAMSVGLVVLASALYSVLRPVNRDLALLALVLKLMEAALVAAIVLLTFVALHLATGNANVARLAPEQTHLLLGTLLVKHTVVYAVPMVLLGLDMMLFFYLFLRSRYVPRPLSAFGILSFALILVHAVGYLVAPDWAAMPTSQVVCYTPSCIVEIVVGGWLLAKGLDTRYLPAPS